jgi:hypothetical protein|tara:strand:+ start:120 stop:317 length:198 start_codon:yes stop_codon:yes gene_type:complete
MGILEKINTGNKKKIKKEDILKNNLLPEELGYLISLISRSDFKGKDIQLLYTIAAKLQNQLHLNK